ncbi:MAG: DUF234 domain-containing protein [Acholeplasmataceae bacterium]
MLLHTELRSIQEYQSVLQAIHSGSTGLAEIDSKSRIQDTAKTAKYVKRLSELEIIEKEYRFLDHPNSKKHLYRIKNNFIAFYYHFVWRNQAARAFMDEDDFYDTFIRDDLDDYVSVRFEKICEQYLVRTYRRRNHEPITDIGRYWYNDHRRRTDVEIGLCVKTSTHIHVYECKWTNDLIGEGVMNGLIEKGSYLEASRYGAFSRSGYHDDVSDKGYDLITIEDMFE